MKIDPEFKSLIPPLAPDEYAQLEANIIAEGCRDPLVVWGGTLIDGHNRFEICERHGIEFKTVEKVFESREDAVVWMIDNQKGRRNLTDGWKFELAQSKAAILKARGIDRRMKNLKKGAEAPEVSKIDTSGGFGKSQSELAAALGWSTGKVAMADKVWKDAPEETKEKVKAGEVSINQAYQEVRSKEKLEKLKESQEQIAKQVRTSRDAPVVELCDAVEWLEKQEPADLLLTDPPYRTDVDNVAEFAKRWLPVALSRVKDTGRAYVFVGAYPEEIAAYLSVAMPRQILVWEYRNTIGPRPSHDYKLNWQAILYYRGKDAPPLDCPIMLEQFSVQTINAPDGRMGDRFHAWQKPSKLAEQIIRHSTKEGDTVIDPFCCTGTFPIAASMLGRVGRGCDLSRENLEIAEKRGCRIEP